MGIENIIKILQRTPESKFLDATWNPYFVEPL
jgi:hypothetical protein